MSKIVDSLGDRMKDYEAVPKLQLMKRTPVIIRIDGKAFHTFTRGCQKPFDSELQWCMVETVKELCANIQNCVLGYTQSDEITLVLLDDAKITTCAYFDNQVQKICSVAASIATRKFNQCIHELATGKSERTSFWCDKLFKAEFDARCFNVPNKVEIYNNLIWRQNDAIKNSITMLALAHFSNKEIHGKNGVEKISMLQEKGIIWNDLPNISKHGIIIRKFSYAYSADDTENGTAYFRTKWEADENTPVFSNNKEYLYHIVEPTI